MYRSFQLIIASILVLTLITSGCRNKKAHLCKDENKIEKRIDGIISKMTLEEKIYMLHENTSFSSGGCRRLGIPGLMMSDGPHGVRYEFIFSGEEKYFTNDFTTYLPVSIALASTWNPQMAELFGKVLGSEARARGKDIILAPGININRTPLNGRNFEYMGEDPLLAGIMATTEIKAIQQQGVSACVKHFALNNQEIERGSISVEVDERALQEIYLPAFKRAVQEGNVHTIMASYNKIRGIYATENNYLLNDILKKQWGFKGAVISDWSAVHTTMAAALGGTDIEMGSHFALGSLDFNNYYFAKHLLKQVKEGKISEELINDKVRRVLRVIYHTCLATDRPKGESSNHAHHEISKQIARESIVLLKNKDHILPLDSVHYSKIVMIGDNARRLHANTGGSSIVKPFFEMTPYDGMNNVFDDRFQLDYALGYSVEKRKETPQQLIEEAVNFAKKSDYAIIFGGMIHGYSANFEDGAYDAEAVDKPDLKLPFGQDELINAVAAVNPRTIVVLLSGGPIEMPWLDKVAGVVQAWYPGMNGGIAIAEVLKGIINPSGKLPVTFPIKLKDSPAHKIGEYPGKDGVVHYNEGLLVGYRYYDTKQVAPLFCFGYGLSYTTFELTNLKLASDKIAVNQKCIFKIDIRNTGKMAGAEVLQVYVKPINPKVMRPEKELKAFKKVFLKQGEKQTISFELNADAFAYYNAETKKWQVDAGQYQILIGTSSQDISQTGLIIIK